ncbi:MAG: hypothetical protein QXG00_02210 [Candidatus Woesearchaeota archaeon]
MNKKGNNAAIVLAITTLLIVLYILFLPPDVRDDLLNEDNNGGTTDNIKNKTLLVENVGRIDAINTRSRDHNLNSFGIYATRESRQYSIINSIYIKNGLFGNEFGRATFSIDTQNAENFLLSFNVEKHEGRLIITLNGQTIFDRDINEYNPEPIRLEKTLLRQNNEIIFKTNSAGIAFWRVNEYVLRNVQITSDITDKSNSVNEQKLYISREEINNLEKATLYFYPRCQNNQAPLLIEVNNNNVFLGQPDCNILNTILIGDEVIIEGTNKIRFSSEGEGRYLIDNIKLKTDLKEALNPIFYFEAEDNLFTNIDEEEPEKSVVKKDYDIIFKLRFTNPYDRKKAEIVVNGHRFYMDTEKQTYTKNIDNFIVPGSNSIEIIPDTSFDVTELRVYITETNINN